MNYETVPNSSQQNPNFGTHIRSEIWNTRMEANAFNWDLRVISARWFFRKRRSSMRMCRHTGYFYGSILTGARVKLYWFVPGRWKDSFVCASNFTFIAHHQLSDEDFAILSLSPNNVCIGLLLRFWHFDTETSPQGPVIGIFYQSSIMTNLIRGGDKMAECIYHTLYFYSHNFRTHSR